MASVQVKSTVLKWVGASISCQVTYEVTFTDWEVKLDLGFTPQIFIQASDESAQKFKYIIPPAGFGTFLRLRQEASVAQPIIRPSGAKAIVLTAQVTVSTAALFKVRGSEFRGPDCALDIRVDLKPESTTASASAASLPIATT